MAIRFQRKNRIYGVIMVIIVISFLRILGVWKRIKLIGLNLIHELY